MDGMNGTTPQLSVVIPCLNEAARLPLLLADLQRSATVPEILLADGGSSDATPEIADLTGAGLIRIHPAGRGRQLRVAAAEAHGDWLLFLHADSRLSAQWSRVLTTLMQGFISFAIRLVFRSAHQPLHAGEATAGERREPAQPLVATPLR